MQSVKQFVALAIIACVYLGCEEQASERDGASGSRGGRRPTGLSKPRTSVLDLCAG